MPHPLHPVPSRLSAMLIKAKDRALAGRVESWMGRRSPYKFLHEWLDAPDNIEARRTLGQQAIDLIQSEHYDAFDQ